MKAERPTFEFGVNNFDLIRLLAAFQVLLVHGIEHLDLAVDGEIVSMLELFPGVPIFFVTSGYLISASLERTPSLGTFLQHRFLRVYPALWTCLLVSSVTLLIFYQEDIVDRSMLAWLVAQSTVGQFYSPDLLRSYGVGTLNGSLWTIPVELQFYAFLPLGYPLLRRVFSKSLRAVVALAVLLVANVAYVHAQSRETMAVKLVGVSLLPYLCMFLVGVYLQQHRDLVGRWMAGKFLQWLALLLLCAVGAWHLGFDATGNDLNPVSILALCGLTLASAYTCPRLSRRLLGGNDLSYGIYIYHMVIINIFVHTGAADSAFAFPAVIAGTVSIAALSWGLIERPALARKRPSRATEFGAALPEPDR